MLHMKERVYSTRGNYVVRGFRALRFALHLGPSHKAKYINGTIKADIPPSRTYVHPGFNALRIMFMIATRAAAIEQRTRLFCGVNCQHYRKRNGRDGK